jgi:hypothetical protein
MNDPDSPLRRLLQSIVLQDVYVREATAAITGAFDPKTHDELNFGIQLRFSVESVEFKPNRDDEAGPGLVRYLIDTGLRFVQNNDAPGVTEPTPIAEITATFVADYEARDASAVTDESLEAFNQNALHHVWPFWREFIHTSSGRLRLPSVILPIRQPLKRPEGWQAQVAAPSITQSLAPTQ